MKEKHQCVRETLMNLPCNPGIGHGFKNTRSDWELNHQPFGSQADTQATDPYQPGPILYFFTCLALLHPTVP